MPRLNGGMRRATATTGKKYGSAIAQSIGCHDAASRPSRRQLFSFRKSHHHTDSSAKAHTTTKIQVAVGWSSTFLTTHIMKNAQKHHHGNSAMCTTRAWNRDPVLDMSSPVDSSTTSGRIPLHPLSFRPCVLRLRPVRKDGPYIMTLMMSERVMINVLSVLKSRTSTAGFSGVIIVAIASTGVEISTNGNAGCIIVSTGSSLQFG